ncbi:hypothetical protein AX774_g2761 [Zancudomyces culisetae]|uniref:Uncharacterized protein n=1 Tax=Zancudomyces culisetae TaxID=1213189 RepID=A0A1R1PRY5_ZANCU|nr:hypothetical protein AX774_g2761 [Zancudomyces culisetae]|eukprot:OMH83746.1 hypothetical protein AX774_g2761 [Zancudomyces culisetae]
MISVVTAHHHPSSCPSLLQLPCYFLLSCLALNDSVLFSSSSAIRTPPPSPLLYFDPNSSSSENRLIPPSPPVSATFSTAFVSPLTFLFLLIFGLNHQFLSTDLACGRVHFTSVSLLLSTLFFLLWTSFT